MLFRSCGANLGAITAVLAAGGAEVHAFEPNPDAFRILSAKVSNLPNVHLHQKAVLDKPGILTLYLHVNYGRNPERFSSGSSLIAEKRNVDDRSGVDVKVIDFPAFVRGLGRPVKLLKVDIEGAEYILLNALIDAGLMDRIEKVYVETHAHAIPSLKEADRLLRLRLKTLGLTEKIDLNWV